MKTGYQGGGIKNSIAGHTKWTYGLFCVYLITIFFEDKDVIKEDDCSTLNLYFCATHSKIFDIKDF